MLVLCVSKINIILYFSSRMKRYFEYGENGMVIQEMMEFIDYFIKELTIKFNVFF